MNSQNNPPRLQSWIPPNFVWITVPDVFLIDVPVDNTNIDKIISKGVLEGRQNPDDDVYQNISTVVTEAALAPLQLAAAKALKEIITVYCHGVFRLSDDKLCVAAGLSEPPNPDAWIPEAIKRQRNFQRSALTAQALLPSLPCAVRFTPPTSGDPEELARAACAAIAASNWPPPRDGDYTGILPTSAGQHNHAALVSWQPHQGFLPSYPEVRWAVQKNLPEALRQPRITQIHRPEFDSTQAETTEVDLVEIAQGLVHVHGFDPHSNHLRETENDLEPHRNELEEVFADLEIEHEDDRERIAGIRKILEVQGIEAIAWFQPYHVWTEETWGIYFDAQKLDDIARSFLDDFKSARIHGSHCLAASLAFGLTYAHELFHARVEAALSWMEINIMQPRHLRYKEHVYQALRETPEWLEEALANWSAWDWFKQSPDIQSQITRMGLSAEKITCIVEDSLSFSPPGYSQWRLGHEPTTWRTFANQLWTACPKIDATSIPLPLESILRAPPPYDFQSADIPVRFAGDGIIANHLQSHPATFHVPARRELERALKYFKHILNTTGGKGSHQKWTGPDQRSFSLPMKDPVSPEVFKKFLKYIGIDKDFYVHKVRPLL